MRRFLPARRHPAGSASPGPSGRRTGAARGFTARAEPSRLEAWSYPADTGTGLRGWFARLTSERRPDEPRDVSVLAPDPSEGPIVTSKALQKFLAYLGDIVPDIPGILYLAMQVFVDPWGNIAIVIIFAIPFLMAWIMGGNATLPAVMGLITGGFIIYRLPEQYQLVAIGFLVLSVIAIIYSLLKEPK